MSQNDSTFFKSKEKQKGRRKMITVDINTLSAYKNGTAFIQNGIPLDGYKISEEKITFEMLERLYDEYKHSVPNGTKYTRFKALSAEELDLNRLVNGQNRQKAQEKLEMALLTGILNKSLVWPDPKKWFWQSERDKDFVLLRKWFQTGVN